MRVNKLQKNEDISTYKNEELSTNNMKDFIESQRIAHIGTWRLNVETNEVVWSEELYKMYGFDSSLPVPPYTEHMKLFTPESWALLSVSLEKTRTLGIPYELELKTVTKEGSNGYMWVRGEAEKDGDGKIVSIWGVAQDISQRKQEENKLKVSEQRFQEVIQNINAGIVVHAPDSSIIDCNLRATQLLGLSMEQLLGKEAIDPVWKFVDEDKNPLPLEEYPISRILRTKESIENMLMGIYHSFEKNITWANVNGTPVLDESGNIVEVIISFIDFTEIKNAKSLLSASEQQYRLLTTQMQYGLALHEIILDENGAPIDYRFINANESFLQLMGMRLEDLVGKTVLELLPYTEKYWIERYGKVALTGVPAKFEDYSSELKRYFTVAAYSPKKNQFAVIIEDVTDRIETRNQLTQEKERFRTTLLSVGDGVISTDVMGNIVIMNKVSEELTGWKQEDAIGKPIDEVFYIINEYSREKCDNPVFNVLSERKTFELANHTMLLSKDGTERSIEDSAAPIFDEHGDIAGVVLVFRDFTSKKKRLEEIEYLNFHDHLTGLYNRRFYEAEISRLDTPRNWPLTIVMGDVNELKLVNDSFGHLRGDLFLKKVAEAMTKACRADDIIARIGGDEFAILLPKTDGVEASKLIKRINALLKEEIIDGLEVSISFGYAAKTKETEVIEEVFNKAEDLMYQNKLYEGFSIKGRVIDNVADALISKSEREEIHSQHVSQLCVQIGEALKFEDFQIQQLKVLGLLHDIGKIAISNTILNKEDKLSEDEWVEMKSHAETGYRILSINSEMKEIAKYTLAHHERWDGLGYPRGLKGTEIPLPSRICAIADAYDAMVSVRSYKSALTIEDTKKELKNNAGKQFDPDLVDIFIEKVLQKSKN